MDEKEKHIIDEATVTNIIKWYESLENQMIDFLKYVPPQTQNMKTWSPRLATLIVEACSLIDSLLRYISPSRGTVQEEEKERKRLKVPDFAELYSAERRLPDRKVIVLTSPPEYRSPFYIWKANPSKSPQWWTANNDLKHSRIDSFTKATLETAIDALAGSLLIIATTPQVIPGLVRHGYLDLSGRDALSTIKNLQNRYGELATLETPLFAISFSNDPLPENIHEFNPRLYGGSSRLKAFFIRS